MHKVWLRRQSVQREGLIGITSSVRCRDVPPERLYLGVIFFPIMNGLHHAAGQIFGRGEGIANTTRARALAELALLFARLVGFDKIGRERKIFRRDKHEARLVGSLELTFCVRLRAVRRTTAVQMPDDADEQITLFHFGTTE